MFSISAYFTMNLQSIKFRMKSFADMKHPCFQHLRLKILLIKLHRHSNINPFDFSVKIGGKIIGHS